MVLTLVLETIDLQRPDGRAPSLLGPRRDRVEDPSAAWPKQRRRVTVGTLKIDRLEHEREQHGDILVFDPSRVTDGIECSDDPVLRFRPQAYSESVKRRT